MRKCRFFYNEVLTLGYYKILSLEDSHHIINVIRLNINEIIYLFNNFGNEYKCKLVSIKFNRACVEVVELIINYDNDFLKINLFQSVPKNKYMDSILRKSVELGIYSISPVLSERSLFNVSDYNFKLKRWNKIIRSSLSQSGSFRYPLIFNPIKLFDITKNKNLNNSFNVLLDVNCSSSLIFPKERNFINLINGPEGGFSSNEIDFLYKNNFLGLNLGKMILRTDTSFVSSVSILNYFYNNKVI